MSLSGAGHSPHAGGRGRPRAHSTRLFGNALHEEDEYTPGRPTVDDDSGVVDATMDRADG